MSFVDFNIYKSFDSTVFIEHWEGYYSSCLDDIKEDPAVWETLQTYTCGTPVVLNRDLRNDNQLSKKDLRIHTTLATLMEKYAAPENLIVYRFVDKPTVREMLMWSGQRFLRRGIIVFDKGYLSTTLTLEEVMKRNSHYVNNAYKILKIYVPKGTPSMFLELISEMGENEMLFPPNTKLRILSAPICCRKVTCVIG